MLVGFGLVSAVAAYYGVKKALSTQTNLSPALQSWVTVAALAVAGAVLFAFSSLAALVR